MKKKEGLPLVSVIMPCYNHEDYVAKSIESVLKQTYSNMELLVLDNGSLDNSYEVIKKYSNKIAKIFHLDENNFFKAGKILRKHCAGQYIAFMTSDDLWDERKIEKQMEVFQKKQNIKACFTWADMVDSQENVIANADNSLFTEHNMTRYEWLERIILRGNCLAYPSAVIEKDVLLKVCENLPPLWQLQDMYIWLHILMEHDIHVIEEGLVKFVWHVTGENRNTSAPSQKTAIRTNNENVFIISKILEEMKDDLFVEVFKKYLRNQAVSTHEEIMCEKFFLLQKIGENNIGVQNEVIYFYFNKNIYVDGVGYLLQECLKNKYNYLLEDFLEYCASHGSATVNNLSMYIQKIEKEAIYKQQEFSKKIKDMNDLCRMQTEKISQQDIWLDAYCDTFEAELDVNSKKRLIRNKVFSRLSEENKYLTNLIIKYLEKVFLCIEESRNVDLEENIDHLIKSLLSISGGLNDLWNSFLFMDREFLESEWKTGMNKITAEDIDKKEFCENIIPFLIKIYTILKLYTQ